LSQHQHILQTTNLSIGYGKITLASALNISIHKGSLVGVFGRNGKGKTTLLKTIAGIIPAIDGNITIDGISITKYTSSALAKKMALVFTDRSFDANLYVEDVLKIGRTPHLGLGYKLTSEDFSVINETVALCDLQSFLHRKLITLSDGEKQRVLLARAIVQQTDIILLDEPTAHLDIPNREFLFSLLCELTKRGKTVIISTHEIELAKKYVHQVIEME
jgi:iron complex transport system ATP-binding protein